MHLLFLSRGRPRALLSRQSIRSTLSAIAVIGALLPALPGFAQSTTGAPANITANGATMSGLQCGTKYRYRITDTSTGTPYTYTFTTSACAVTGGPQATTMAATNVGSSGATFNGSVMPNGADTSVSFDYGTSTAYGTNVAASPASVTASSPATSVSASVTSLACGTSYHFRVKATNSAGTASGADQSFTTAACPASAPVATTSAATNPGPGGATLNGSVTPNGAATSVTFDYGTSTGYGSSIAASPASIAASAQATAVTGALSGLKCGTTYHFRVHATNGAGTTLGNDLSFATTACAVVTAPQATTNPGSGMTGTGGTVNGSVAPDGGSTTVSFDYGTTTAYGSSIAATPATLAGTSPVTNVTANLSNLACATTYHFRVVAVNSAGTSRGADQALTTAACGTTSAGPWPWPTWTGQVIAVPPSSTGNTYYVDGTNGSDTNAGTSATAAFKTLAKAVGKVAAGDTVLIRKGLYREGINLGNGQSGTAGKPITFGSYGDGEVILDGSAKVTGWTLVSGTVWQAQASFKPIGVVVNDVPLKQVTQGQGGSTAPQVGLAGVTSGSGKWYVSSNVITADFGTTLGSGDPNGADIVVPNSNGAQEHIYWYGSSYVTFQGLTIRGSGSNGLWGYGNNITVLNCDIKFNGKAAVSFLSGGVSSNSDNAVLYSEAYHNVLLNWPRGNNGYMEDGGGWPGTLVWESNLRPLARGNIVHMNGGEGILSYGTQSGRPSGSALFEQNVSYDNWSVDMYFDNQPNDVARQNLLFNHPPNPNDYLYVGKYPYDSPGKFAVCIMLADEQNSSDSTNGYANLRGTQVHDNIMAGCRIGIRDYSEGTQAIAHHGLKDTTIANNTIVMAYNDVPNSYVAGIYLQDNGSNNTNSVIQNNIVYGFNQDAVFFSEHAGALAGINVDFNDYYSTAAKPFGSGYNTVTYYAFAGWKAATPGADTHSLFQDPLLDDAVQFRTQGTAAWNYASAGVAPTSPTINSGTAQSFAPAVNFAGAPRVGWSMGAL